MDEVTQQNAALVEQAAAAAESLQEQAGSLGQAVAVFTVGETGFLERRGPDRATNVERLPKASPRRATPAARTPKAIRSARAAGGGSDEWEEF